MFSQLITDLNEICINICFNKPSEKKRAPRNKITGSTIGDKNKLPRDRDQNDLTSSVTNHTVTRSPKMFNSSSQIRCNICSQRKPTFIKEKSLKQTW